jgi:hypothetical protein
LDVIYLKCVGFLVTFASLYSIINTKIQEEKP